MKRRTIWKRILQQLIRIRKSNRFETEKSIRSKGYTRVTPRHQFYPKNAYTKKRVSMRGITRTFVYNNFVISELKCLSKQKIMYVCVCVLTVQNTRTRAEIFSVYQYRNVVWSSHDNGVRIRVSVSGWTCITFPISIVFYGNSSFEWINQRWRNVKNG